MKSATMTLKDKCLFILRREHLFLLLTEEQGAADRGLFADINMGPVIVVIIPGSLQ